MKKVLIFTGLICALATAGCSKSQVTPAPESPDVNTVGETDMRKVNVDDLAACVQSASSATISAEQWADANNAFGMTLLAKMPAKTTVVSPYSVERAVGMVYEGACGDTAAEMRKALALPDASNLSLAGAEIEKAMLGNIAEGTTLAIDNRVWLEKTYVLLEDYVGRVKTAYNAAPTALDFKGDPDGSRIKINDDVAASTKDRIQNLLPPGTVDNLTRLVLTNAVYFKAPWMNAFVPEKTVKADFMGVAGTTSVDMMHHIKNHRVYMDDAFVAFDMDFTGGNYAFMVVLPKVAEGTSGADALKNVEAMLTADKMRQVRNQMDEIKVDLAMPKFKIEAGTVLGPILRELGMNLAFGGADFRGISGEKDLFISEVIHKAFIEVTEEGAEAAAVTAVVMKIRMIHHEDEPMKISVDHPFFFSIVEKSSGTALFVGHVTDL